MKTVMALVAMSLLCACRYNPTPELDSATPCYPIENPVANEIFVPLAQPVVYVNRRPELSTGGGDFLHIMPLQVSHNGYRLLYLWVGLGSTIDYPVARATSGIDLQPTALALDLRAQGAPEHTDSLLFPLVEWQSGRTLKAFVNMPITASVRTGLTHAHLRALANSGGDRVELVWPSGRRDHYHRVADARNEWTWGECDV